MFRTPPQSTLLLTIAVISAFLVTISAIRWWDQEPPQQRSLNSFEASSNLAGTSSPAHDSLRHTPIENLLATLDWQPIAIPCSAGGTRALVQITSPDHSSGWIAQPVLEQLPNDNPTNQLATGWPRSAFDELAFEPIPQPTSDMLAANTSPTRQRVDTTPGHQPENMANQFAPANGGLNDFEIPPDPDRTISDNSVWTIPSVDRAPLQTDSNDFAPIQVASATAEIPSSDSSDPALTPTPFTGSGERSFSTPSLSRNASSPIAQPGATQTADSQLPHVLRGADQFKLAEQPKPGEHYRDDRPITDPVAHHVGALPHDFSPDPTYDGLFYDSGSQAMVYEGKQLYANQRPLVELGRPWYQLGQLSPGYNWFGKHNTITPQFLVYGDYRTTVASNTVNGDNQSLIAHELNLDLDLKLTGTERFHAFISPLDDGVRNTRYLLDEDELIGELDANFDFGYFEGDLGAIVGGMVDETLPFDMPFAIGVMPLLLQNGIWMEDAFLGIAATIPARNSARLNISNMDITFFAGYDKITSPAFPGDDSAARMYGVASFIEALNGYFEIDYAFLDDRSFDDRSYHNLGFAYSRRFGRLLSNSTRVIVNAGQSTDQVANTADGVLLLSENSLITGHPSTLVPYCNLFAGFDRPQSAARAAQAGGILRNTGILFESDGMTNYPTLDPTANDTFGGALGINLIASDFSQQLVLETAMLGVMGDDANRNAPGEQIGIGFRYQLPLTNAVIFRADGMYGWLNDQSDIRGLRFELRRKW